MRQIDADALIASLEQPINLSYTPEEIQEVTDYKRFIKAINNAPTTEIKLEGHWRIYEYEYFSCSLCGRAYYNDCDSIIEAKSKLDNGDYYPYCPFCGNRMNNSK